MADISEMNPGERCEVVDAGEADWPIVSVARNSCCFNAVTVRRRVAVSTEAGVNIGDTVTFCWSIVGSVTSLIFATAVASPCVTLGILIDRDCLTAGDAPVPASDRSDTVGEEWMECTGDCFSEISRICRSQRDCNFTSRSSHIIARSLRLLAATSDIAQLSSNRYHYSPPPNGSCPPSPGSARVPCARMLVCNGTD